MRLTNKSRWGYDESHATLKNINNIRKRDEWLKVVKKFVPDGDLDYLELGCAPGQYSAVLSEDTQWKISGIDYSDDAETFIKTMSLINKDVKLYKIDMFSERVDALFDIVISIGLVEHFRGELLDHTFKLHDSYIKPGGYLIIQIPNFTGFQYLWHYLFDRPDLDNHNVDVMQPDSLKWFEENGYEILFNDYVGILRLWGNSSWNKIRFLGKIIAGLGVLLSKIAILLAYIGIKLRGRTWSPGLLLIAKKQL
jgi:SAM-dependent methyltransferase